MIKLMEPQNAIELNKWPIIFKLIKASYPRLNPNFFAFFFYYFLGEGSSVVLINYLLDSPKSSFTYEFTNVLSVTLIFTTYDFFIFLVFLKNFNLNIKSRKRPKTIKSINTTPTTINGLGIIIINCVNSPNKCNSFIGIKNISGSPKNIHKINTIII